MTETLNKANGIWKFYIISQRKATTIILSHIQGFRQKSSAVTGDTSNNFLIYDIKTMLPYIQLAAMSYSLHSVLYLKSVLHGLYLRKYDFIT